MSGKILIYTTAGCPHSQRVVQIFEKRKIPYSEINLAVFPLGVDDIAQRAHTKSIPQVFFNSKCIGGLQNILTLVQQGKLEDLAQEALKTTDPATPQDAPKPPEQPLKHIKMNPVYNDIFLRANGKDEKKALKKSKKQTFKGSDFINWLVTNNGSNKEMALKLANSMKEAGFFCNYKLKDMDKPFGDDDIQYQFLVDRDPDILNGKLLNPPHIVATTGEAIQRYPGEIGAGLLYQIFKLFQLYSDENGTVNYIGMKEDPLWVTFQDDLMELSLITVFNELLQREKTVFLLQVYQILRLHLLAILGSPPTTLSQRQKFINEFGYKIQGHKFTLNVIATVLITGKYPQHHEHTKKKKKDKLNLLVFPPFPINEVLKPDPRVFFGTIRSTHFSPPILYLYDKNVDFALHWATEVFSADVKVSRSKNLVMFPSLFSYVKSFFSSNSQFLSWVIQFLPPQQEAKLRALKQHFEMTGIVFARYPWENEASYLIYDMDPTLYDTNQKVAEYSPSMYIFSEEEAPKQELPEFSPDVLDSVEDSLKNQSPLVDLSNLKLTHLPSSLVNGEPHNFIKRLVLTRNSISFIPPSFGFALTSLSIIDFSHNDLTEIPNCFADLHLLETLNLSHNCISTISNRFCSLRMLKNLYLNCNQIANLPLGFAQLRSVEDLNLSNNLMEHLPHNFGEMGLLETLDVSNNKLAELPDLSNLLLLIDLFAANNQIRNIDFGLKGLRHLITMDLSCNEIVELPKSIEYLVYLNELDLSKNQIEHIPAELCELLSMKDDGLDLSGNPISNLPSGCYSAGISAIRLHFGWNKPLPKVAASRGRPMEMMSAPARIDGKQGSQPLMTKSLSVRDKRHMLMKNKTKQVFGNELIQALREKNSAQDSGSWLQKAEMEHFMQTNNANDKKFVFGKPSRAGTKKEISSRVNKLGDTFIKIVDGYNIEFCVASSPGRTAIVPITAQPELQDFDFKPDYHTQFYHQAHTNFFGNVKGLGPVIISIMDVEDDSSMKPRRQAERARSMNLMRLKIKADKPSDKSEKTEKTDKSEKSTESPNVPKLDNSKGSAKEKSPKASPSASTSETFSPPTLTKSVSKLNAPLGSGTDPQKQVSPQKVPGHSGGALKLMSGLRKRSQSSANALTASDGNVRKNSSISSHKDETDSTESHATPERAQPRRTASIRKSKILVVEDDTQSEQEEPKKVKAFVRTPVCDTRTEILVEKASKTQPKDLFKTLKDNFPELAGTSWKNSRDNEIEENIVALEMKLLVKGYKFGILYAMPDQKTEAEFFQNRKVGKNFEEFIGWLGETVPIKNWTKYNAGLDTGPGEATGKESLYTTFREYEIMFHVSTMLPFTEGDPQQLARKRHLGNDIVLIIFQEGKNPPFDPSTIRSFFNHVFFVISKDKKLSKERNETCYKVGVTYKDGVREFQPALPPDGILIKNDLSREWLLTKLINSERAAYSAPGFSKALQRTREILLSEIVQSMTSSQSSGWG